MRHPCLAGREPGPARRPYRDSWCPLVTDLRLFPCRPIGAELIAAATAEAASKKDLPGLARLEYIRWAEGRCAQLLHIGPYAAEAPSIVALHEAIAEAGYRPHGRHHEIYLGDPRRSAPEKLRTIIRHPVEPV